MSKIVIMLITMVIKQKANFAISEITKCRKKYFFCRKICTNEKKVVTLHPIL